MGACLSAMGGPEVDTPKVDEKAIQREVKKAGETAKKTVAVSEWPWPMLMCVFGLLWHRSWLAT